ncbi:MAG: hypothetical protein K2P78_05040 [Gemmataceae bacterium]|nr:hypothetical protein [Gemmataceae bacterium]
MRTFALLVVSPLLFAATTGCSGPDGQKPVFPVGGKVTFNGESMAGAIITFHPLDNPDLRAQRSTGVADKDGVYELTTYPKEDGAPAGEYAVTVYWPDQRAAKGKAVDSSDEPELAPDRLKRSYADPKTTKLRATVREQSNTIDFTLP